MTGDTCFKCVNRSCNCPNSVALDTSENFLNINALNVNLSDQTIEKIAKMIADIVTKGS